MKLHALLLRGKEDGSSCPVQPRTLIGLSETLLPEILEVIFSNLSQHTIHTSVILVCKHWYISGYRLLRRRSVWSDNWLSAPDPHAWRRDLERYNSLALYINFANWGSRSRYRFATSPEKDPFRTIEQHEQEDQPSPTHLRELVVRGSMDFELQLHQPLLPYFRVLRILRLEQDSTAPLDIGTILRHCVNLNEFHLAPRERYQRRWSGGVPLLLSSGQGSLVGEHQEDVQTALPLPTLNLRQFVVRYALASVQTLLAIINAAPDLRVFSFTAPHTHVLNTLLNDTNAQYAPMLRQAGVKELDYEGRSLLYARIPQACPMIYKVHIMQHEARMEFQEIKEMVKQFSKCEEWAFEGWALMCAKQSMDEEEQLEAGDFMTDEPVDAAEPAEGSALAAADANSSSSESISAALASFRATHSMIRLRHLCHEVNRLTSLEIDMEKYCSREPEYSDLSDAIHWFLCDSPLLLHLKAPRVSYFTKYMNFGVSRGNNDAKDRLLHMEMQTLMFWQRNSDLQCDPTSATNGNAPVFNNPPTRRIWACRSLQTLQLTFCADQSDFDYRHSARILFGYLSLVCPNLRELWVTHRAITLDMAGGLCLLSRLEMLEKLTLEVELTPSTKTNPKLNFWWMASENKENWTQRWKLRRLIRREVRLWSDYPTPTSEEPQIRQQRVIQNCRLDEHVNEKDDTFIIQELSRVTQLSTLAKFIKELMRKRWLDDGAQVENAQRDSVWPRLDEMSIVGSWRYASYYVDRHYSYIDHCRNSQREREELIGTLRNWLPRVQCDLSWVDYR
ncbi:hypothetical protein BGZ99_006404 [Dissophora globulifera]|uniref:F-box domain-containing protein n=1 Tax=Dissophora globulifera TaxID=979702 RepID=A0A9P6RGJ4_9FUNG|nr:hypothetical protein BGZ99_006404 [Dissophora globulifera]